MLGVVLGVGSVLAVGLAALVGRARARRIEIVDMTAVAPASKRGKRSRPVDAVVLHQMAFSRGNDVGRYKNVTAHFIVVPDGTVAQLHPIAARLPASDGFNARAVAVEFAGNLRSANGNWWKPDRFGRDELTPAQAESGRRLLRVLEGMGIRHVFAHRQSSAKRGNDPGPEIWSSVAQWGIDDLGMSDGGQGYAIGGGKPIPAAWRTYRTNPK